MATVWQIVVFIYIFTSKHGWAAQAFALLSSHFLSSFSPALSPPLPWAHILHCSPALSPLVRHWSSAPMLFSHLFSPLLPSALRSIHLLSFTLLSSLISSPSHLFWFAILEAKDPKALLCLLLTLIFLQGPVCRVCCDEPDTWPYYSALSDSWWSKPWLMHPQGTKLLSASAEQAGMSSKSLTKASTWMKRPLDRAPFPENATSELVWYVKLVPNMANTFTSCCSLWNPVWSTLYELNLHCVQDIVELGLVQRLGIWMDMSCSPTVGNAL